MKSDQPMNQEIICDAHCDTVLDIIKMKRKLSQLSPLGHVDIPRLKIGGTTVQGFALYIEDEFKPDYALKRTLQLLDVFESELYDNNQDIADGGY